MPAFERDCLGAVHASDGASQATTRRFLALTFDKTSRSYGVHDVNVAYAMTLDEGGLTNLPEGDSNSVIQPR